MIAMANLQGVIRYFEIGIKKEPSIETGVNTQEIQEYMDAVISANFDNYTSESDEMMTSEGGDGRFHGKVFATRYAGISGDQYIFLAIGETEKKVQIVKFGNVECLKPGKVDLEVLLEKELGIKTPES